MATARISTQNKDIRITSLVDIIPMRYIMLGVTISCGGTQALCEVDCFLFFQTPPMDTSHSNSQVQKSEMGCQTSGGAVVVRSLQH